MPDVLDDPKGDDPLPTRAEPLKLRNAEASRLLHWARGVMAEKMVPVPVELDRAMLKWQHGALADEGKVQS